MPRKARSDEPGALHHIVVRGIERRKIFRDDNDRDNFLERLGAILGESRTPCFAWALMPNHFHLLLKTGQTPYDFERVAERVAILFDMPLSAVLREGRYARTVAARRLLCYWANRDLGLKTVELARRLNLAQLTISQSVDRGERIALKSR